MSFVTPEYIKRLEFAAQIGLGIESSITPAQRHEGEKILLSFRNSKPSLVDCRTLLEHTTLDTVQYQAVAALKDTVIREWEHTEENERGLLQQFVLNYVMNNQSISHFVQAMLTQLLAVMIKLNTVKEKNPKLRESIYTFLKELVSSGDQKQRLIACSIITALVTEFSITNKSSDMGITWEQHWKCKKSFEDFDLKTIFTLVMEIFQHIDNSVGITSPDIINLCHKFLMISEQVLSWTFTAPKRTRRSILIQRNDRVLFKPHSDWKNVLLISQNIRLFFNINLKCQTNEDLSLLSTSCIAQLASLQGAVFSTSDEKCFYLKNFVHEFLRSYGDGHFQDFEASGVASICKNLMEAHNIEIWAKSIEMQQIFQHFLQCLTKLTCTAMAGAAKEEEKDEDDHLYMEAFENILDAWTTIIESLSGPKDFIAPYAIIIFEHYVTCHILPPEGSRSILDDSDVDIDEIEEEDRDRFAGQLMSIASLARTAPLSSLVTISSLLEKRITVLNQNLLAVKSNTAVNQILMQNLYEDLHWLILIAGHVLADECEGETSMIPQEIIHFSIAQKSQINQELTLQILGSPDRSIEIINSAPQSVDTVIRIISVTLNLCHVLSNATRGGLIENLSPQLLQDLIWFLKTWMKPYLLFKEEYYDEISPAFSAAFGPDSDGGRWCANHVTNFICIILNHWSSEPKVLEETAEFLTAFVECDKRCAIVAACEEFWRLGHGVCTGDVQYKNLPPIVKQQIMSSVVKVGTSNMNLYKDKYWEQTMNLVKKRYHDITAHLFNKTTAQTEILNEVMTILDLLHGVAEASTVQNTTLLFNFMSTFLSESAKMLQACQNNQTIIISILELFVQIAHKQICFLSESKCRLMYEWSLSLLKTFSTITLNLSSREAEEESFQDLSLVIELLTNLLNRDFIDFSDPDLESQTGLTLEDNEDRASVADVVLFGLGIILPHMNTELLAYPSLCCQYYKLVTFMCEIYPEKVGLLPQNIFNSLMYSLQIGLNSYGTDNCKLCLEALLALVDQACEDRGSNSMLQTALIPFIKMVFDVILIHAGDMDLLNTSADTFYSMFHFNPKCIMALFSELVAGQSSLSDKQLLITEFSKLTPPPNTEWKLDRKDKTKFIKLLEEVIFNVRGILCVK